MLYSRLGGQVFSLILALALAGTSATAAVTLVHDGAPLIVIVLPESPHDEERLAADEIVEHIMLMTGATVPVVTVGQEPAGMIPVRLGAASDAGLETAFVETYADPFAFVLKVTPVAIHLKGNSPAGTRTAAYELLEQLGIRWYMPGEIGRVVPRLHTAEIAQQYTRQAPAFAGRRGTRNTDGKWNERLRLGGQGRYGAHGIMPFWRNRRQMFAENPELFALIDGERRPRQLCLTNSTDNLEENQVLQIAVEYYRNALRENPDLYVLNMGPDDGGGYCECAYCRALDPPGNATTPFATPVPSFTDRYVWFFNQLTDALADEFPGVRIGFYAYAQHIMPPVHVEAKDNLAISLAPIHVCRIHGPNNPVCPESNFPVWAYEQWRPYAGTYMADRGYMFNLADPGFPFSMIHRIREEIPTFYGLGVRIWAADPPSAWASHNPSMYVLAKLLWNPDLDVDALLEEYYSLFYGPAAQAMADYYTRMDHAIRDADCHTGSVWDIPRIYPAALRAEVRQILSQAAETAAAHDDPIYAQRIAIQALALDFLDAYCLQRERRDAFDFVGAREAMEDARRAMQHLVNDFEIPMLNPRHAVPLFNRFIERQAVQEYESIGGADAIVVAPLDHTWQFQLDPQSWGQFAGLHRADASGGNWQTIRTDNTWSGYGLRYYFGQAWYRQEIDIPEGFEDKPVHLWFSGVDNTAEVWVNGTFVGANHGGGEFNLDAFGSSFRPFHFDVTDAIRHGALNVVTVRTARPRTNEIGTGGIMGPVMFYIPGTHFNGQ